MSVTGFSAALLLAGASSVQASPDAPPVAAAPATVAGARSYTPADFARFSPNNALDMVRQVPGFTIQEQEDRRGLGQASANVLINGQRFSGKSNDVVTELGRISAANVVRIDIVEAATLNIPGLSGQVSNIITQAGGLSGNFAWYPQFRTRVVEPRLLNGEASLSGQVAGFDFTVAVDNESYRNGNEGPEIVFTPDGTITDRRAETLYFYGDEPKASFTLKRQSANGAIFNLNGSVGLENRDVDEISLRTGAGQIDRNRRLDERERERTYELGGDYEFGLGGGRLKLIGLRRYKRSRLDQEVIVRFADGRPDEGDRFEQIAGEAETIGRAEYRWKEGAADWQVSTEGALNILDVGSGLFRLSPGGAFDPVPLPNSTSRVEEKRGEALLTYGRPLSPDLTAQAALGGEYSKLTQSGEQGLARSFVRPKGFASLAWKVTPRLNLSARIEREVGQLNFFDFVASANVSGGTTNAGNVNLVPQQSWNAEVEGTNDLGIWGTLTTSFYAEFVTDIVDIVPIGEDGQAPGNLDRASVFGVKWISTFNFDPLGLRGAKLDLELQAQRTRLDDPVTGVSRPISEKLEYRVQANFRHDVPGTNWAYGAGFDRYVDSPGFRIDQLSDSSTLPGNLGLFVEHKDVIGMTVRGGVDNLLDNNDSFDRAFYDGRRTGRLLFTESRDRHYGLIFTLSVSGKL